MVAADNGDSWLQRQRWRQERMRFEVLAMLYQGCDGKTGCVLRVSTFADNLGVWREELFRVIEWLDRKGYLVYHGAGPSVSLTRQGVDYVERYAGRRRSLRD